MKLPELTQHHRGVQADAVRIRARTQPQMPRGACARCCLGLVSVLMSVNY